MKVLTISEWDETFFENYVQFRNSLHAHLPTDLPQNKDDYHKFFGTESPFKKDFRWQAFVVIKNEKTISQGILSWRIDSLVAHLGYLDLSSDDESAALLFKEIINFAKTQGLQSIKTPVDINLFVRYRIRVAGEGAPFYGEPRYPDYYPELFEKNGFSVIGEWDTYELRLKDAIKDFFSKRKSLSKKKEGGHSFSKDPKFKTTIRSIKMKNWDQELQIIYNLFVSAYTNMPEFETISFDQFKLIYDDFKYIVQPWLSYIVELQGKPVGFSINFVDPLPILTKYKDKKLNNLQKAWVFARLRMNRSTLMIAHVGKIPGPNGEDIKGVQIQVSKRIAFFSLMMKKVIVTFQNTDSPSRRTWNEDVQKPYARYLLYGISL